MTMENSTTVSYEEDHQSNAHENGGTNNLQNYQNDQTQPQVDYSQTTPQPYGQDGRQPQPPGQYRAQANFTYNNAGPPGPNRTQAFPPQSPQNTQQYPPPPPQYHQTSYPSGGPMPSSYSTGPATTVQFPPPNNGGPMPHYGPGPSPANVAAPGFPVGPNPGQVHPMMVQQQLYSEAWRTGLFDCMDDPMSTVITAFCPCITFGQVAEILDNGQTSCATSGMLYGLVWFLIGLPCIMSCTYRTKLRTRFGLLETPASDWVTHFLCEWCAICQAYRELQLRDLDPSIGWQGNVAKAQAGFLRQQANMAPPMNQRMMH